jgi:hypothetical protein
MRDTSPSVKVIKPEAEPDIDAKLKAAVNKFSEGSESALLFDKRKEKPNVKLAAPRAATKAELDKAYVLFAENPIGKTKKHVY